MSMRKQRSTRSGGLDAGILRRPSRSRRKLKPERVQEELKTMPGWRLMEEGNALVRTRRFTQLGEAAKFAARVAAQATRESHRVSLCATGGQVTLTLQRPNRNGIDMPLLDFARQLD
jgi:pterin-4a-carbinolamine dehydratase